MTEETQNDFDNILVPKGLNSMMELSNQDLLTFIQNHTTQNNNTRYQGVQNSNMQTPNNPTFVTNKNETQIFPSQEPSSTTQEQRLESFTTITTHKSWQYQRNPTHLTPKFLSK